MKRIEKRVIPSNAKVTTAAPQFLVEDLERAVHFFVGKLGFDVGFIYESFYAGVSRGGATIHLKCAPKDPDEQARRKENEHLDAYIAVVGIDELYAELKERGATFSQPIADQDWGCREFYVEDPDGNMICFSEVAG